MRNFREIGETFFELSCDKKKDNTHTHTHTHTHTYTDIFGEHIIFFFFNLIILDFFWGANIYLRESLLPIHWQRFLHTYDQRTKIR